MVKAKYLKWLLNAYPPFLGAGIHVDHIAAEFSEVRVTMKLRWYNRNYVGTHFGGSLYAMTDPFYMLMMINKLGKEYIVWDKAATIDFAAPGQGTVTTHFRLTDQQIEEVKKKTDSGEKYLPEYSVEVVDQAGNVVARVTKRLYVRKRGAVATDGD